MGNDQVRFDLAVKASGDYQIVAPSAKSRRNTRRRAPTSSILESRGFGVRAKQKAYTINENLLGVTLSAARSTSGKPGRGIARLVRAARAVAH
jgi:argininosuccinate synthase